MANVTITLNEDAINPVLVALFREVQLQRELERGYVNGRAKAAADVLRYILEDAIADISKSYCAHRERQTPEGLET